eukprot:TRINITY_DN75276_c0_g1_i1.p1 TRINITY_DN75276_c0_g1~~TRINITY_DN75276_c0_g1_i1.p1  ORF type:complete len:236 (+),score=21.57 TRINITY_DN75276_c0_g1_i1:135-842(+)
MKYLAALFLVFTAIAAAGRPRVSLYVMSRCPDAANCETVLFEAINSVRNVSDLELIYIGNENSSGPQCLHGPEECIGNMEQLCVQAQYGAYSAFLFSFCEDTIANCVVPSGWRPNYCVPKNSPHCATAAHITMPSNCTQSSPRSPTWGDELLRQSFARSEADGVRVSCTVRLYSPDGAVALDGCNVNGGVYSDACAKIGIAPDGTIAARQFQRFVCTLAGSSAAGKAPCDGMDAL